MAFDIKPIRLLRDPINTEIVRLPLLRTFVYLLTLWVACNYPLTAPDEEFTVFKLNSINKRFLRLNYFDKSKTSYKRLDEFVAKEGWATSRSSGGRTYYKITAQGARQAADALDAFGKLVALENEERERAKAIGKAVPGTHGMAWGHLKMDPLFFFRLVQQTRTRRSAPFRPTSSKNTPSTCKTGFTSRPKLSDNTSASSTSST